MKKITNIEIENFSREESQEIKRLDFLISTFQYLAEEIFGDTKDQKKHACTCPKLKLIQKLLKETIKKKNILFSKVQKRLSKKLSNKKQQWIN